jgi:hypothetical protein
MSDPFAYNFEEAFHGPLGEYARRNEKRVEIDSLSLLLQLLAVVGVVIGRRAYTKGGPDRHYPNLFTLIVGNTSIGKGCSGTVANELGAAIDPGFAQRTAYNVASAPALVQLVSDGLTKTRKRKTKDGEREDIEVIREAVVDKRVILFLPEMRGTLVAQSRDGSTLKDELKNVWDGRTIENNKYHCRERATDPHVGLIGHITPNDLAELATRADVGNGYFNRFLITAARRARTLPFPVEPPECRDLLYQMRGALDRLGPVNQGAVGLEWADDARAEWASFFCAVREGSHPVIADVQDLGGRVFCLAMRAALIFAILDNASAIHLRHLRAGKAVALEALNRSRHLFVGNRKLFTLPEELRNAFANREDEWTKTNLHRETGNRHRAGDMEAAAAALVEAGEWIVREGKTENGHSSKFWSLAPTEAPPTEAVVSEFEQVLPERDDPLPDGMVEVEGVRLQRGACIETKRDVAAFTFAGESTNVICGAVGYLAAPAPNMPKERQDAAHDRLEQHPKHVAAIFDGEVLFVPWEALRLVKETVAA